MHTIMTLRDGSAQSVHHYPNKWFSQCERSRGIISLVSNDIELEMEKADQLMAFL